MIHINDKTLKRSSTVKYLGLFIDDTLNWSSHVNYLSHQLARFSGVFYRLRNYVNKETLSMLYYSLVYSRIRYGIIVWGTADKTRIECLRVRLNIILSCGIETPTTKLYSILQFLKIDEIYEFELYKFMYQLHHGKLPKVFTIRLQILTLYMFTIQDSKIPLRIFYLVLIKIFAKTNFHTEGTNYGVNWTVTIKVGYALGFF